jgi:soluble cytochrome b562
MAKPGRNDPCHCGSGKKYKKCCQPKEQVAEGEVIAKDQAARAEREAARRLEQKAAKAAALERFHEIADVDEELDELTTASNAAVDLVNAGKLEEAEAAARDLIARYPEVHDGWDRLGMMYEPKATTKRLQTATARHSRSSASVLSNTIRCLPRSSSISSPSSTRRQAGPAS